MKVKICGITNLEDAMQAISFGADALGFQVGMRNKTDEVSPKEAKVIVASLPPFVSYVMVTHLQDAKTIISLLELIQKTTTVQLHDNNDMDLKEISAIREKIPSVRIIKAIHIDGSEACLQKLHNYDGLVDALILDSVNLKEDRIGGTGILMTGH